MIHKWCWQRWLEDFGHHQNNDCNFCREAIFCIKLPWNDLASVLKNQIVRSDYNEYSRNCQLLKNNWMTDPRIFERDAKTNFYCFGLLPAGWKTDFTPCEEPQKFSFGCRFLIRAWWTDVAIEKVVHCPYKKTFINTCVGFLKKKTTITRFLESSVKGSP